MNNYIDHDPRWYEPDEEEDVIVFCPHCGSMNPDTLYRIDGELRCEYCVEVIQYWDDIYNLLRGGE